MWPLIQVVPECPYVMDDDYLAMIFEKLKIDYVVHGDDPCIVDGKNVYQNAIDQGKYRTIPRTEGVSTTDIVGRMLLHSKEHHDKGNSEGTLVSTTKKMMNRPSNFLTTSNFIQLFSQPVRMKPKDAKVIYIDGAWDMFHSGHIKTLERARAMGDYLIVGVVNDEVVNQHRGANYPIMNLNERVLSVVGCRYADDVLIDAPWEITADMIKSLGIHTVVSGTTHDEKSADGGKEADCYKVPKQMGIFQEIKSESSLTVTQIVSRILAKEQQYRQKCTGSALLACIHCHSLAFAYAIVTLRSLLLAGFFANRVSPAFPTWSL
jgi:ethanolamine-phosphate cytidylyltransferase